MSEPVAIEFPVMAYAKAFFVVFPMKGLPIGRGWKPDLVVGALLLNGAWGFGVALFMRFLLRAPAR